ncbi:sialate O-acetylesterase [Sphingomonas sanxanigenens]|uniref:Sialate O-acetylesterase domain-containing protein n=1 Tax=Sphingomonas sanxanigenens DSM 19645 = NX02 TaxID=1123269 RepID=W0AC36_9SPHN|nr:sialate O-acetylesterase [Sphingomonas sanxanigenens]AHE53240.1 hypothetical protein NX02_07575 [Sphingomonas sanxanigenens DSM 19645 = NX02]
MGHHWRSLCRRRPFLSACAAIGVAAPLAAAPPRIDVPLGDHAVLQRDQIVVVTGSAAPHERLAVKLGAQRVDATADAQGQWRAELKPLKAGGPYRLDVTGAGGETTTLSDLLVGDVWLCSGQSNMEYPLKAALNGSALVESAADPQLRLLTMAQRVAFSPDTPLPERPSWSAATPESAADFSAACFLMVKALKAEQRVPMGAIDASWGGTQIRPWIPAQQARALPGMAEDADLLGLYHRDPPAAMARFARRWGAWWRGKSGDAVGSEPWNAPDKRSWHPVPRIAAWEDWGVPETADFNGTIWFRQGFDLPQAPKGAAELDLGGIDELDVAWVNGVPVGSSFGWGTARRYTVPASALRAGRNEIVVAVSDSWATGGMLGPAEDMQIRPAGEMPIALGNGWRYSVQKPDLGRAPRMPWESHAGLSTLYNGMIAPLGPIGLKGVAWYQGESDAGLPGYDSRMAALMAGWRQQFRAPALPFVIVGLANFGPLTGAPVDSGWAVVRDEQRKAAAGDGHAAIVTAVNIGERTDIHPANKNELAKRMARAAAVLAYSDERPASGPLAVRAVRDGDDVLISFVGITGRLNASSAPGPIGFELCGAGRCRFARARIEGDRIRLNGDGAAVEQVRYAWADAPIVNLFDDAGLPAVPFALGIEPRSER